MTEHTYEKIYREFGKNLPWCLEGVPKFFKSLIESKWVKPCKTLDMGCGIGDYANYLALNGFEVLAVDISETAIDLAKKKYTSTKNLQFKIYDIFKLKDVKEKYDFVYEISILHNIEPKKRAEYIKNICSVLNKGGKLLVCSFSKDDLLFQGKESLYFPDLDNTVYPLSEKELRDLFQEHFKIKRLEKVYFGREGQRQKERWLCLMEKK